MGKTRVVFRKWLDTAGWTVFPIVSFVENLMTMHLLGPAYTTTQTRKRNSKISDSKFTKWAMDWRDDCKRNKRLGIKSKTFDEYIQYRHGNYKPKLRGTPLPQYQVSDHRQKYPSQNQIGVHLTKDLSYEREKLAVSSNYIVGQAYNKGGLVVLSKSDAADPATGKRRG
jgi:hypothetical protein